MFSAGIHSLTPTLVGLISQQVKQCLKQLPQLHLSIKASLTPWMPSAQSSNAEHSLPALVEHVNDQT